MNPSSALSELRGLVGPGWRDPWSVSQAVWEQVTGLAAAAAATEAEAYDRIGEALARAYVMGELSYVEGDTIANDLYAAWVMNRQMSDPPAPWPEVFLEIYLAFDGGEYRRTADPDHDPVGDCTDPAIAAILDRLGPEPAV